jgi:hypothetical protein
MLHCMVMDNVKSSLFRVLECEHCSTRKVNILHGSSGSECIAPSDDQNRLISAKLLRAISIDYDRLSWSCG